jgi:(R)-2-hydroxyacyl-CoA dehydratese activating ATPase
MITAGIDIGSISTKAAVISDGKILGTKVIFTGYNAEQAGIDVYDNLLSELGVRRESVSAVVSTGYGRNSIKFATKSITEISCHGAGAFFLNPEVRSVIDIGGQDSKALLLDSEGRVRDFAMNDKCAAGTGRFIEVMARALQVDLDDFGSISHLSGDPSKISSLCTVFAESEVISLISKGESREKIITGIHESVASRVAALTGRIGRVDPVMMTGGVAKNKGFVAALEKKLGTAIMVTPYAQVNGAVGAAVLAVKL